MTDTRLEAAARRALESLNDLILDSRYPGPEAIAARFELEQALLAQPATVPSAPADRAAILREAADIAESLRQFEPATGARKSAQVSENVGILRVAAELRRMADEAQQSGPDRCSGCRYVPCGNCPTAAVSQPGKEA